MRSQRYADPERNRAGRTVLFEKVKRCEKSLAPQIRNIAVSTTRDDQDEIAREVGQQRGKFDSDSD